jgi:imidazolonepropionase-like amidohydrolase
MEENFILHAGWMIDGTGTPAKKNIRLELERGKIHSVQPDYPGEGKRASALDFSECTLLPGLVDSHVHLFMSGTKDPLLRRKQLQITYDEIRDILETHFRAHLGHGVMAVRDGGDYGDFAVRFKREFAEKGIYPGFLKVAGRAWHAEGRYGHLIGRTPKKDETLGQAIGREGKGIDQVKVIQSGLNSLTVFGKETKPQFLTQDMKEARAAAERLGLNLMVHANGRLPVKHALVAGCDSIEHGFFMGPENLEMMAAKGIYWVPTAITMKAYSQMLEPGSLEAKIAAKNLEHQLEQISQAREYGVKIAVGTDAGSLGVHHGWAMAEEIRLFLDAGMTIEEAIKCATFNGAALLGISEEIGCIKKGLPASFIIVNGPASTLPGSLRSPERLYFKGRPVLLKSDVG